MSKTSKGVIWLVTSGEPCPNDGASTRLLRTGMLAYYLSEVGHEVVWWNSDFNHQSKSHRVGKNSITVLRNGLTLRLLRGCGYSRHVSFRRIRDHFQVASTFLREASLLSPPMVIVAGYPTIELADACRKYGKKNQVPYIVDVRDMWPDIFADIMPCSLRALSRIVLAPYDRIARRALRGADAIFGITKPYLEWGLGKARRARRSGDAVIPFAYPESSQCVNSDSRKFWRDQGLDVQSQVIICFFGTFGRQFDIATVIDAARELANAGLDSFRFVLCGEGDHLATFRNLAANVPQVIFPGWIDGDKIRALMEISHLGLAPYFPSRNFVGNLPNKVIEYMSSGLPILTCLEGLVGDLVAEEGIGYSYASGDSGSLGLVLKKVLKGQWQLAEMKARSRLLFERKFRAKIVLDHYHKAILVTSLSAMRKRGNTNERQ